MISSFPDAGYLIRRRPHLSPGRRLRSNLPRGPCHAFLEKTERKRLLRYDLLQITSLAPQVLDLIGRCRTRRVARKALLPGLQELLRPAVLQALSDAFTAAQPGNAVLARKAVQHDPDLPFSRILLAGRPTGCP